MAPGRVGSKPTAPASGERPGAFELLPLSAADPASRAQSASRGRSARDGSEAAGGHPAHLASLDQPQDRRNDHGSSFSGTRDHLVVARRAVGAHGEQRRCDLAASRPRGSGPRSSSSVHRTHGTSVGDGPVDGGEGFIDLLSFRKERLKFVASRVELADDASEDGLQVGRHASGCAPSRVLDETRPRGA